MLPHGRVLACPWCGDLMTCASCRHIYQAGERAATERIKTRFEQVEDMVDLGMIPDRKVKKAVLFGEHLNNQTPDDGGKEE